MTEINPPLTSDNEFLDISIPITAIYNYLTVRRTLGKYNLSTPGLICLIMLYKHPTSTIGHVRKYACQNTAINGIKQLLDLALVREVKKPRLIIPFQRYKVDKGYILTAKGEQLLRKILVK